MNLRSIVVGGLLLAVIGTPAFSQPAAETRSPRFQFELLGGTATLRENSLNRIVDYQEGWQNYFYDLYLSSLYTAKTLTSWTSINEDAWTTFGTIWPLGARLKYQISDHIVLSLGIEYLKTSAETAFEGIYSRNFTDGKTDEIGFDFRPFAVSARALAPLFGFHFYQPAKEGWSAEGGLLAGPLFGRVAVDSTWTFRGDPARFSGDTPLQDRTPSVDGTTHMEGTGIGYVVEVEARLSYFILRNAGAFLNILIGFRHVPKLSGPGTETRGGVTTEWDGEWAIKKETIERSWGTYVQERPSNNWTAAAPGVRTGDFALDLSGIWLGGGLFFRF